MLAIPIIEFEKTFSEIKPTEWLRPVNQDISVFKMLYAVNVLKSIPQEWEIVQFFITATISSEEEMLVKSSEARNDLKNKKENEAKKIMINFCREQFGKGIIFKDKTIYHPFNFKSHQPWCQNCYEDIYEDCKVLEDAYVWECLRCEKEIKITFAQIKIMNREEKERVEQNNSRLKKISCGEDENRFFVPISHLAILT